MSKAPNFFTVARQPKWIGALFLSLAVAGIFAALGQWQLERTFTKDSDGPVAVNMETVSVALDTKNVYIVANRLNDDEPGYWLITNSVDSAKQNLTIALGWSADLAEVEGERDALMESGLEKFETKLQGVMIPSEAPKTRNKDKNYIFESLSVAQLVNIYSPDKGIDVAPMILALNGQSQASAWPPLKPIDVTYDPVQKINWLSAFYFAEWVLFAGFAIFLWWRLVKDEQTLLANGAKVN